MSHFHIFITFIHNVMFENVRPWSPNVDCDHLVVATNTSGRTQPWASVCCLFTLAAVTCLSGPFAASQRFGCISEMAAVYWWSDAVNECLVCLPSTLAFFFLCIVPLNINSCLLHSPRSNLCWCNFFLLIIAKIFHIHFKAQTHQINNSFMSRLLSLFNKDHITVI